MIYAKPNALLSRALSGYVVADTSSSIGWRPQYRRLGVMPAGKLPDWKTAAAVKSNALRRQRLIAAGRQRMFAANAAAIDAHARGQRLSGLGTINPGAAMQPGQNYTFHFQALFGAPNPNDIAAAIAPDTNFSSIAVGNEPGGGFFYGNFYVNFTYTGVSSNVLGAGSEMTNVISDAFPSGSFTFLSAESAAAAAAPAQQASPGQTPANSGAGLTYPGQSSAQNNNPNNNPPFNWNSFWAGMGLSAATGTALAIGAAVLLLRD